MLPYERKRIEAIELRLCSSDNSIQGTLQTHHDKVKYLRKLWDTDTALSGIDVEEVIKNHLNSGGCVRDLLHTRR